MARGLPLWVICGGASALAETALEFRELEYQGDMAEVLQSIGRRNKRQLRSEWFSVLLRLWLSWVARTHHEGEQRRLQWLAKVQ